MRKESIGEAVRSSIDGPRLLDVATQLVGIPSPTRSAGPVAGRLAELLEGFGFRVERPVADWPEAPAVVVRLESGQPGRVLQYDGHLDTVHLPYEPPRFEEGLLHGSGAADMKGGIAAAVEALIVLRELGALEHGGVLLTVHEHHEGPWGDLRQVQALIRAGVHGDAVLLPEYLADRLPVAGKGSVIFSIRITRPGEPVHEISRPPDLPDVIAAGVDVVNELYSLDARIRTNTSPISGRDSVFIGSLHSGEIYNQSPTLCTIDGVRRWVTPGDTTRAVDELRNLLADVAARTGTQIDAQLEVRGDAFELADTHPLVLAFQAAHETVTGMTLPTGDKPFVDDGNQFAAFGIPAITHGPRGSGAHTPHESVPLAELERVAQVYALAAMFYCNERQG